MIYCYRKVSILINALTEVLRHRVVKCLTLSYIVKSQIINWKNDSSAEVFSLAFIQRTTIFLVSGDGAQHILLKCTNSIDV